MHSFWLDLCQVQYAKPPFQYRRLVSTLGTQNVVDGHAKNTLSHVSRILGIQSLVSGYAFSPAGQKTKILGIKHHVHTYVSSHGFNQITLTTGIEMSVNTNAFNQRQRLYTKASGINMSADTNYQKFPNVCQRQTSHFTQTSGIITIVNTNVSNLQLQYRTTNCGTIKRVLIHANLHLIGRQTVANGTILHVSFCVSNPLGQLTWTIGTLSPVLFHAFNRWQPLMALILGTLSTVNTYAFSLLGKLFNSAISGTQIHVLINAL